MKKYPFLSKLGLSYKQILYLLLSDLGYALAIDLFYSHNNIAAGGLAGIGTVINSFLPINIGATVFILNIPIVLFGLKIKGKKYVFLSLLATAIYSLVVDALSFLPCLTDDKLVAVICGGILYGTSAALAVKAQISTGGTDLLAKLIITKFKSTSIGTIFLCIDGSIVLLAIFAYGNIESGIYAILAIAVCSIVVDKINSGFNKANIFYIFANKNTDKISDEVLFQMHRGVTSINGIGMFSNTEKRILMVVVKPNETPKLKSIVHKLDPTAFIVLAYASEIIGEGFEDIDLTTSVIE